MTGLIVTVGVIFGCNFIGGMVAALRGHPDRENAYTCFAYAVSVGFLCAELF